jgi:hypothetical protein
MAHYNHSRSTRNRQSPVEEDFYREMYLSEDSTSQTYDYLKNLLEEEFESDFLQFEQSGILHFELLNLETIALPVFDEYRFPQNENSRFLRYEIIALIRDYLNAS